MIFVPSNVLRRTLSIDAVVSAASALLLLLAGDELAQWLAVPETLLRCGMPAFCSFLSRSTSGPWHAER